MDDTTPREFLEHALRTGILLADLITDLAESLPGDAYPGEHPVEVVVDMMAGTIDPVVRAAGTRTVAEATALLTACVDRILADLETAVALARRRGE